MRTEIHKVQKPTNGIVPDQSLTIRLVPGSNLHRPKVTTQRKAANSSDVSPALVSDWPVEKGAIENLVTNLSLAVSRLLDSGVSSSRARFLVRPEEGSLFVLNTLSSIRQFEDAILKENPDTLDFLALEMNLNSFWNLGLRPDDFKAVAPNLYKQGCHLRLSAPDASSRRDQRFYDLWFRAMLNACESAGDQASMLLDVEAVRPSQANVLFNKLLSRLTGVVHERGFLRHPNSESISEQDRLQSALTAEMASS